MRLSKTGMSLGIAAIVLGTALADTADAQKKKKTGRDEGEQTSNVSDFTLELRDTGKFLFLCYGDESTDCNLDDASNRGLLESSAEGSLESVAFGSNILEYTLFFNDVKLINPNDSKDKAVVDFTFFYEFDFNSLDSSDSNFNPTFLEVDDIEAGDSLQKVLDFLAIGDPTYDIFDDFVEGLGGSSSVPGEFGSGGAIFLANADGVDIKDDASLQAFMARAHSEYGPNGDNSNFDPEPLNEFDEIRAEGEDLVDVPEPGMIASLLAFAAVSSGRLLAKRKQLA